MYSIWDSNSTHASESNFIQYKNPDLDKAIDDSRSNCAPADRKAAFKTANQILNDQQPYNFGFAAEHAARGEQQDPGHHAGSVRALGAGQPETWWVQ